MAQEIEVMTTLLGAMNYLDSQPRQETGYHSSENYQAMFIIEDKITSLVSEGLAGLEDSFRYASHVA